MMRETRGSAIGSLVLCAALWSTAGILIKLVQWDAFAIAGGRSLFGFVTMLILLKRPKFTFSANQILAAFSYSATMILFVTANKLTTSANAVLLQYVEPVYIILLGLWLLPDEKVTRFDWFAVAAVLGGMVLFFFDDLAPGSALGNALAIASGVTFAMTAVFMRRQQNERPADSFMLAHLITFAVSLPFMIRSGPPDGAGLLGLALLGVFQMGILHFVLARNMRHIGRFLLPDHHDRTGYEPGVGGLFWGELPGTRGCRQRDIWAPSRPGQFSKRAEYNTGTIILEDYRNGNSKNLAMLKPGVLRAGREVLARFERKGLRS